MTSNSSKALPYMTLIILVATLGVETYLQTDIDLETYLPFLMAIGLGGAGLKAVREETKAKKMLPQEIKTIIEEKYNEMKSKGMGNSA